MPVTVLRDGREFALSVKAEAPPASPSRDERTLSGANPFAGATVVYRKGEGTSWGEPATSGR